MRHDQFFHENVKKLFEKLEKDYFHIMKTLEKALYERFN